MHVSSGFDSGVDSDFDPGLDPDLGTGPLGEPAAEAWIPRTCFKTGPPGRLGIELELHPFDAGDPRAALTPQRRSALWDALQETAIDGRLTGEPGGQVELSSPPAGCAAEAVQQTSGDLRAIRAAARSQGIHLAGLGVRPDGTARRLLDHPRYLAMEAHFAPWAQAANTMMCLSASVQVNVEAATREGDARRWDVLHAAGPALVAAFANSPARHGRPTGWRSTRMAAWLTLDPARTHPPRPRPAESVGEAYARWALDAPLLAIRRPADDWLAPPGVTFRDWITHGERAVPGHPPPTRHDLEYHLSTLFPPVRARGYLEVRYLDAQPGDWWVVPVAVVAALMEDPLCAETALKHCDEIRDRWWDAARDGVADRAIGRAALAVLVSAAEALHRLPGHQHLSDAVERFTDRWTSRGRSPADDIKTQPNRLEEIPC